jgi:hypothetical protein
MVRALRDDPLLGGVGSDGRVGIDADGEWGR